MIFPLRERNVCEVWLRDELKKWSSHFLDNLSYCLVCAPQKYQASSAGFEPMTSAIALQRSWVRILLKTPDIFQVHKWDNHWDCPASVRITSSLTFILPLFYLFGVGWSVHCCNKFINSTEIQKKKHSSAFNREPTIITTYSWVLRAPVPLLQTLFICKKNIM